MKLNDLFETNDYLDFKEDKSKCPHCEKDFEDCCCIQIDESFDIDSFEELISESIIEEGARIAWARKGKKVVKKYRCTVGRRKGRIVSNPTQCSKPIDMKKRRVLKKTKARLGSKMARKARKTKRMNPASRRLKRLNRR